MCCRGSVKVVRPAPLQRADVKWGNTNQQKEDANLKEKKHFFSRWWGLEDKKKSRNRKTTPLHYIGASSDSLLASPYLCADRDETPYRRFWSPFKPIQPEWGHVPRGKYDSDDEASTVSAPFSVIEMYRGVSLPSPPPERHRRLRSLVSALRRRWGTDECTGQLVKQGAQSGLGLDIKPVHSLPSSPRSNLSSSSLL